MGLYGTEGLYYPDDKGGIEEKFANGDISQDLLYEQEEDTALMRRALGKCNLTDRERYVLERLHGFGGHDKCRQLDIAAEINVSESRVSQLHRRALGKLQKYIKEHDMSCV